MNTNINSNWFRYLNKCSESNSLLNNVNYCPNNIVVRDDIKGYKLFNNCNNLQKVIKSDNYHLHEVILGNYPNKLRFDIDCSFGQLSDICDYCIFILDNDINKKNKLINYIKLINENSDDTINNDAFSSIFKYYKKKFLYKNTISKDCYIIQLIEQLIVEIVNNITIKIFILNNNIKKNKLINI